VGFFFLVWGMGMGRGGVEDGGYWGRGMGMRVWRIMGEGEEMGNGKLEIRTMLTCTSRGEIAIQRLPSRLQRDSRTIRPDG